MVSTSDPGRSIRATLRALALAFLAFAFLILGPACRAEENPPPKEKPVAPRQFPKPGSPLLLSDCIREAMENNPKILIARQNIDAAKGGVISARSKLYPTIDNSTQVTMANVDLFQQSEADQSGVIGFHHDWQDVITINYNIYSAGVNGREIEIAELGQEITSLQLHEAVNNVVFDTQITFNRLLVNQSEIEVRKKTIALLQQELQRQQSLFEAGRVPRFNIIRTEVRLSNELPGLEQAQVASRDATAKLLDLMGMRLAPGRDLDQYPVSGQLNCPAVPTDADYWIIEALGRSPELSRQEKQIVVAHRRVEIAKAALIPRLDLFTASRLRQKEAEGSFWDGSPQATFGIRGTWNIFDGFDARGRTMQAEAKVKSETILKDAVVRRIEFDVRRAVINLQQAERSLRAQKGNVEKANESVRLARSSVEAGLATQFDILQATVDLATAQNVELRTRLQYHQALAELEKVTFARVRSTSTSTSPLAAPEKIPPLRVTPPMDLRPENQPKEKS